MLKKSNLAFNFKNVYNKVGIIKQKQVSYNSKSMKSIVHSTYTTLNT